MTDNDIKEPLYGCLYVAVGTETQTANLLETVCPELQVYAVKKIKHRQTNGVRTYETEVLLPGYLIFTCPPDFSINRFYLFRNVRRILRYKNDEWQLQGDDLAFAKWVVGMNGEIGLSQAVREGTMIRIVSGPLKDCEGQIIKVDKHRRNCLVTLGFDNQLLKTWLAFDWLEPKEQGFQSQMKED